MADGVGFEPTEGFHLRRFSRPVLSTAQSPIRLLSLLCTLGQGIWQENFEIFGHSFDYWLGESDVNNLIPKMIEELLKDEKII